MPVLLKMDIQTKAKPCNLKGGYPRVFRTGAMDECHQLTGLIRPVILAKIHLSTEEAGSD
jgi:hypothetical protein